MLVGLEETVAVVLVKSEIPASLRRYTVDMSLFPPPCPPCFSLHVVCPPAPLFASSPQPRLPPPTAAHQSSLQVALGALSVVRAAVSDRSTALRLVKLGIVSKLAALVRQKPAGPPPPLPPRRRGSGAGAEQRPHEAEEAAAVPVAAAAPPRRESAGRREEVCAALRVLAGLAEHEACVSVVLEKEDLGFLLQVDTCGLVREAADLENE